MLENFHEEKQTNPNLPVIAIQLTTSAETIKTRIKKRNPNLSAEEIDKLVSDRAIKDRQRWSETSGKEVDLYDPNNFDFIVDTNNMSVEKVFDYVQSWLLDKGLTRRIGNKDLPESTQIFPNY